MFRLLSNWTNHVLNILFREFSRHVLLLLVFLVSEPQQNSAHESHENDYVYLFDAIINLMNIVLSYSTIVVVVVVVVAFKRYTDDGFTNEIFENGNPIVISPYLHFCLLFVCCRFLNGTIVELEK